MKKFFYVFCLIMYFSTVNVFSAEKSIPDFSLRLKTGEAFKLPFVIESSSAYKLSGEGIYAEQFYYSSISLNCVVDEVLPEGFIVSCRISDFFLDGGCFLLEEGDEFELMEDLFPKLKILSNDFNSSCSGLKLKLVLNRQGSYLRTENSNEFFSQLEKEFGKKTNSGIGALKYYKTAIDYLSSDYLEMIFSVYSHGYGQNANSESIAAKVASLAFGIKVSVNEIASFEKNPEGFYEIRCNYSRTKKAVEQVLEKETDSVIEKETSKNSVDEKKITTDTAKTVVTPVENPTAEIVEPVLPIAIGKGLFVVNPSNGVLLNYQVNLQMSIEGSYLSEGDYDMALQTVKITIHS